MRTSLIVAVADNGVIGLGGDMPWHISADLRYFKQVTMGAPVIMGRKTYQSIGRALPGRANIVVSRNSKFEAPDADVAPDVDSALSRARTIAEIKGGGEVFVIGGAEVYEQAMGAADRIYLTRIHAEFPGDAFFPILAEGGWQEISLETHSPELEGGPSFSFTILDRMG